MITAVCVCVLGGGGGGGVGGGGGRGRVRGRGWMLCCSLIRIRHSLFAVHHENILYMYLYNFDTLNPTFIK